MLQHHVFPSSSHFEKNSIPQLVAIISLHCTCISGSGPAERMEYKQGTEIRVDPRSAKLTLGNS